MVSVITTLQSAALFLGNRLKGWLLMVGRPSTDGPGAASGELAPIPEAGLLLDVFGQVGGSMADSDWKLLDDSISLASGPLRG